MVLFTFPSYLLLLGRGFERSAVVHLISSASSSFRRSPTTQSCRYLLRCGWPQPQGDTRGDDRDDRGDDQAEPDPCTKVSRSVSRAPETAMASVPPIWRLVLNTPLAVPAVGPCTLLSSTAV